MESKFHEKANYLFPDILPDDHTTYESKILNLTCIQRRRIHSSLVYIGHIFLR